MKVNQEKQSRRSISKKSMKGSFRKSLDKKQNVEVLNQFLNDNAFDNHFKNSFDKNFEIKKKNEPYFSRSKTPNTSKGYKYLSKKNVKEPNNGYKKYYGKVPLDNKRSRSPINSNPYKNRLIKQSLRSQSKSKMVQSLVQNKELNESNSRYQNNYNKFMRTQNSKELSRRSNVFNNSQEKVKSIKTSLSQAKKDFEEKMKKDETGARWRGRGSMNPSQRKVSHKRLQAKSSIKNSKKTIYTRTMYNKVLK